MCGWDVCRRNSVIDRLILVDMLILILKVYVVLIVVVMVRKLGME